MLYPLTRLGTNLPGSLQHIDGLCIFMDSRITSTTQTNMSTQRKDFRNGFVPINLPSPPATPSQTTENMYQNQSQSSSPCSHSNNVGTITFVWINALLNRDDISAKTQYRNPHSDLQICSNPSTSDVHSAKHSIVYCCDSHKRCQNPSGSSKIGQVDRATALMYATFHRVQSSVGSI